MALEVATEVVHDRRPQYWAASWRGLTAAMVSWKVVQQILVQVKAVEEAREVVVAVAVLWRVVRSVRAVQRRRAQQACRLHPERDLLQCPRRYRCHCLLGQLSSC